MRLATILITSGREDKTEQTLRTFKQHNGVGYTPCDVMWLHGDDASATKQNAQLAKEYGYKTVHQSKPRLGAHAMRYKMIRKAMARGATHIFLLENDWESVQPMPWSAITAAFDRDDVWAFRLYHEQKQADGTRPCGTAHYGRAKADPAWEPVKFTHLDCEIGDIHFGAPPCVFDAELLAEIHRDAKSESGSMKRSGKITKRTVRVQENIFWHIGYERTPGFRK